MENEQTKINESLLQLVSFNIGTEEFGVDILKVQEINRMLEITKVPNSPEFVEGVINLRGRIIPVIDLRIKLGLEKLEWNSDTRIIVMEISQITMGFIVDRVSEVLRVSNSVFEAPPEIVSGINSDFISSIGKLEDRLLILLDLNKILSLEETRLIEKVA